MLTVIDNRALNPGVFELTLGGAAEEMRAGQFVEIAAEGFYLRRPISVARFSDGVLTLIIKIVGGGTDRLSRLARGDRADVLTGLGHGFDKSAEKPLLIGGGIGCAPLYQLAAEFAAKGVAPEIILGFRNGEEMYYLEEFGRFGNVTVATDDGSAGLKGNVLQAVREKAIGFDRFYACGPAAMLRAAASALPCGQISLEARMGCGFGACMGCSIKTTDGFKRVCKEGPVFEATEVIWE